jgi:hypothetical protein
VYVYFAGMVSTGNSLYVRGRRVEMLLWAVTRTLLDIFQEEERPFIRAISTAYSESGERLLEDMEFFDTGIKSKIGKIFIRDLYPRDISAYHDAIPNYKSFVS